LHSDRPLQSIQAEAAVTGTLPTNDVYNNQNVVLIRPADGPVVETAFRSDDFNVYPPRNRTAPPGASGGQRRQTHSSRSRRRKRHGSEPALSIGKSCQADAAG
jgi:hypothetical protein